MDETCQSCGGDGALRTVRRVYVTPQTWETEGAVEVAGLEQWCDVCVAHYPHQAVGAAESAEQ